ncbi:MAG: hypothetical protein ACPLKX_04860 [Dictyoglomaceae bacterium]
MRKGVILLILIGLIFSITFGSPIKIKNDETIYVLLDQNGKVQRVDLVNWIEIEGKGSFHISKDGKYLKNIKLYTEDVKMTRNRTRVNIYGNSSDYKNIYLTAFVNRKPPLEFKITYKYNGKISQPKDFIGKSGDLDIEIYMKPTEDLPFRVVMSTEFSSDDFVLRNPNDFMVMVLGKTVRLTGFTYPIPDGKIVLSLRSKKLKVPAFTFTALPSIPPIDLSMKDQLKSFYSGMEGFLLLNQAHQKILKGILEGIEKNTPTIPQEFLTLPFTLITHQNKAYAISNNLKNYPKNFSKLYDFIKEKAEKNQDEDWKKALTLAEDVKNEIELNNMSDDVKNIGDFMRNLAFQSTKAIDMISASLQGVQNIEELLNKMLYGGEMEGKKIPGLVEVEKDLKNTVKKLKENIDKMKKGQEKLNYWSKKLENYNFAGSIPNANSVVRFYFRLKEVK